MSNAHIDDVPFLEHVCDLFVVGGRRFFGRFAFLALLTFRFFDVLVLLMTLKSGPFIIVQQRFCFLQEFDQLGINQPHRPRLVILWPSFTVTRFHALELDSTGQRYADFKGDAAFRAGPVVDVAVRQAIIH